MRNIRYPQRIRELFDVEVLSEAAFIALYHAAKNSSQKYQFGTSLHN